MDNNLLWVPGVQKIAVFRATALGDFIFALPALAALHQTYPQAEIVYLGRDWHSGYLPGRVPGIDRVIAVPPAKGEHIAQGLVIDPAQQEAFLHRMQGEHFDLAFQMQGAGGYSNPFVSAFGARLALGARAPGASTLDRWIPYTYYQNEVVRMLDIAALAGARTSTAALHPRLPVLAADLAAAAPIVERISGPFAVLHPGSTDPRRCWSEEYFARTADWLHQSAGLEVVLTGVDYEKERLERVQQLMRSPAHNLCGQLSLPALTGLLAQAKLMVSNDTGPLHLGLAVGVKAVGIFWSEYIINSMPLSRANFLPLISWERSCPRCGSQINKKEADTPSVPGCTHEVSFVNTITFDQVIEAVKVMLAVVQAEEFPGIYP